MAGIAGEINHVDDTLAVHGELRLNAALRHADRGYARGFLLSFSTSCGPHSNCQRQSNDRRTNHASSREYVHLLCGSFHRTIGRSGAQSLLIISDELHNSILLKVVNHTHERLKMPPQVFVQADHPITALMAFCAVERNVRMLQVYARSDAG